MPNLEVQLEVLAKVLPKLMRVDGTTLYNSLKDAEVQKISEKNFRIPSKITNGWTFGAINLDAGASIRGTGPTWNEMVGTFQEFGMAAELSQRQLNVHAGDSSISKVNILKETMEAMVPEWSNAMEAMMYSNGKAFCFTATAHSAASGTSVYTGDTVIGCRRLRRGVAVTVYDTTGATVKGTAYVTSCDYIGNTVTLSATIAGAANTDIMTYGIFAGAQPTGMYGLKFWNDNASTGTTLGINRANEVEIRATNVAAGSAALTQDMALLLQDRIIQRTGQQQIDPEYVGFIPAAQRATIMTGVQTIQRLNIDSGPGAQVDRLPMLNKGNDFQWAGGIKHRYTLAQDSNRIDYIIPSKFRRAVSADVQFFEVEGKGKIFPIVSTTNGAPTMLLWFMVIVAHQIFNLEPRHGGYINGLTQPTGY